jgi:hypothetical protein
MSVLGREGQGMDASGDLIVYPAHALFIVEERLKDQATEGVRMPEGMPLEELALRVADRGWDRPPSTPRERKSVASP